MLAHSRMNPLTHFSSPYHHVTVNQTNAQMKKESVAENKENTNRTSSPVKFSQLENVKTQCSAQHLQYVDVV